VLLDVRLKDGDGVIFLGELRATLAPEVPVIMATAFGDSERTIAAMKLGAFDYVTKPFDLPALLDAVERAVRQRGLAQSLPQPAPSTTTRGGAMVPSSPSTSRPSRRRSSRASSSATRRARSPAPSRVAPAVSNSRPAARSSSTRSATSTSRSRRASCACCARTSTTDWA